MKLRNKILELLLLMVLIFGLVGCAKCISTEYKNVEVTIVDEYYKEEYLTPMVAGKSVIPFYHAAVYEITVEYNDVKYTINDEDTYNKYKDVIGQTTTGKLKILTYDDGTTWYDIVSLE